VTRLDVFAETREVLVLRVHGNPLEGATDQQRGVVCYVRAGASAATVAAQLRSAADKMAKP
jgi:hypothetical protein